MMLLHTMFDDVTNQILGFYLDVYYNIIVQYVENNNLKCLNLQKALRRVVIEEIGADEEVVKIRQRISSALSQQSETKQRITEQDNQQFERLVSNHNAANSTPTAAAAAASGDRLANTNHTSFSSPADIAVQAKQNSESGSEKQPEIASQRKTEVNDASGDVAGKASPGYAQTNGVHCDSSSMKSASADVTVPPAPTTSYQFQADCKRLKVSPEIFYQYFKVNVFCGLKI